MGLMMRFLTTLIFSLFLTEISSIHVHHALKETLQAKEQVSSRVTMQNPFVCAPNQPHDNTACPALFGAPLNTVLGGGVPAFGAWRLMMGNAAGAHNNYVVHSTCAAAGVPGNYGLYQWGTAAPVLGVCPAGGAAAVTLRYCGRSIEPAGMVGRCQDYNPNVASWNNVGSHQQANFHAQLSAGQCLYYRWADYGANGAGAQRPYLVCQTAQGTRTRPATRKWIQAYSDVNWVSRQERLLIGAVPSATCPWNAAAGANPAAAAC